MRPFDRCGEPSSVSRGPEQVRCLEHRIELGLGDQDDVLSIATLDDVRLSRLGNPIADSG
jgi:hypothetical protein